MKEEIATLENRDKQWCLLNNEEGKELWRRWGSREDHREPNMRKKTENFGDKPRAFTQEFTRVNGT